MKMFLIEEKKTTSRDITTTVTTVITTTTTITAIHTATKDKMRHRSIECFEDYRTLATNVERRHWDPDLGSRLKMWLRRVATTISFLRIHSTMLSRKRKSTSTNTTNTNITTEKFLLTEKSHKISTVRAVKLKYFRRNWQLG